ncbi:MAG: hypothetical protein V4574_11715 [Pseudomonadota bacterium]
MPSTEAGSDEIKRQLEIEKLRLEIKYAQRSFYAQIINTISFVIIALLVFYFFQRPQIDQMEIRRISEEKMQAISIFKSVREISNDIDRKRLIKILEETWPNDPVLASLIKSEAIIANGSLLLSKGSTEGCEKILPQISALERNEAILSAQYNIEVRSAINPGVGPYSRDIDQQRNEVASQLAALTKRANELHCK